MKVQNVNNIPVESMTRADLEESASPQGQERIFASQLSAETSTAYIRHIEELIGQIEKQGRRLSDRADMAEMQKYREMITKLVNETVSNGFVFHKEGKIGVNGRSKIFAMIKTVNEKLDAMTKKVLEQEKDNIDLVNDVDDIRGLLVDMYL